MSPQSRRPHLRLVPDAPSGIHRPVWFCGHCGAQAAVTPPPISRVCERCALGLMLEADADTAPRTGEPFLVVDVDGVVRALSREAERRLGARERDVVDRPLDELLAPAGVGPGAERALADAIADAAARSGPAARRLLVRPANVLGVRVPIRVGHCGPPRAALLVLELPDVPAPSSPRGRTPTRAGSAAGA